MKNLTLIALAFFLISACNNSQTQQQGNFVDVDSEGFKKLVDAKKGILLDVRTPKEIAEGHIAGAIAIDFYEQEFESNIQQLNNSSEVYVYCARGRRSVDASNMLLKHGFTKVYNLEKGFDDWKAKGLPIVTQKE